MENITKVHLLNVPIENDYKHTIYFTKSGGKQAQYDYFYSKKVKSFDDFSYQRKDKKIRVPVHFDELYKCNYVMYQNTHYSDKWFYAFITKKEYIDEGRTDIFIETDVIQTWFFDYEVKQCFIDREHTDNDGFGSNTIPEEIEYGDEFVINGKDSHSFHACYTIIESTYNPYTGNKMSSGGTQINGNPTGSWWFIFDLDTLPDELHNSERNAFNYFIDKTAQDGQSEQIRNIFAVPQALLPDEYINWGDRIVKPSRYKQNSGNTHSKTVTCPTSVDKYTPKNNKLLCYPYSYLLCTNNCGSSVIYRYEDFYEYDGTTKKYTKNSSGGRVANFTIDALPTIGSSIKIKPTTYKGLGSGNADDYGIICGKFPTFSWSSDAYTCWLTQNAKNIESSYNHLLINSAKQIGTGAAQGGMSGGGWGALIGAGIGTANSFMDFLGNEVEIARQTHNAQFIPQHIGGNLSSGDVLYHTDKLGFHFYKMSVRKEFALIIDGFFTKYGYKCHRTKTPLRGHRESFWYTKTVDCDITGQFDNEDMQKIKAIYNNGITFWRNANEIGDYSVSNGVRSTPLI